MTNDTTTLPDTVALTDRATFLPSASLGIPAGAEIAIHFLDTPNDGLHMVTTSPDGVTLMARVPSMQAGLDHLAFATANAADVLQRLAAGASPGQPVPNAAAGSRQVYGASFVAALALGIAKAADTKRTAN